MASGRPRQPDDPGIMASVEAAVITPGRHAGATPNSAWPYLDRGAVDGGDPEEPALYSGLGHMWPFG